jgi:hypothetical protein
MKMLARRRQMRQLKELAAPFIRLRQVKDAEYRRQVYDRLDEGALAHARNLSLLILFGSPKENEPLSAAWQRCRESDAVSPSKLAAMEDPFGGSLGVRWLGEFVRREILCTPPGTEELKKLDEIFAAAPAWLVYFTGADATAAALELRHPDILEFAYHYRRGKFWFPALPRGSFSDLPSGRPSCKLFHDLDRLADEELSRAMEFESLRLLEFESLSLNEGTVT